MEVGTALARVIALAIQKIPTCTQQVQIKSEISRINRAINAAYHLKALPTGIGTIQPADEQKILEVTRAYQHLEMFRELENLVLEKLAHRGMPEEIIGKVRDFLNNLSG
jgi:uncharacterized protein YqgV (UPF0045/DUF77 family)